MEVSDQLQALGDPSGRQDSSYWDEWFEIVGRNVDHFEWYCRADALIDVCKHHLVAQTSFYRMVHPGSGTSLAPLTLGSVFPQSEHAIVDVSDVALKQLQLHHSEAKKLRLVVADLLQPPLDELETSFFDCWVDKGFLDAVFSKDCGRDQPARLFDEANRVLKVDGFMMIVSLAEEHSLDLIVSNWVRRSVVENARVDNALEEGWSADLHIWELEPSSGQLRPFGFVLVKSTGIPSTSNRRIVMHKENASQIQHDCANGKEMETVKTVVEDSRRSFQAPAGPPPDERRVLVTLELKPYDTEIDLAVLGERIVTLPWTVTEDSLGERRLSVEWRRFEDDNLFTVVPVGYGICKLLLKCVVSTDDVDLLTMAIEEWPGDDFCEDGVQSVDIDWSKSVPVGDATSIVSSRKGDQ